MREVYEELLRVISEGGGAALATIVSTEGSTPRKEGAKIVIKADGSIVGTIGGGEVEHQVCQEAAKVIREGKPRLVHYGLTDKEPETGMICGGDMQVFIEPIVLQPALYLFGGGHISLPLARMGKILGFRVVVVDEQAEFANQERFPEADVILVEEPEKVFEKVRMDESSYIVIATRGHHSDERVLQQAATAGARYVGMIGSSNKVETIFSHLRARGVPQESLESVHAPIGLDIHAQTPEEIAVSILAEIIKVQRA